MPLKDSCMTSGRQNTVSSSSWPSDKQACANIKLCQSVLSTKLSAKCTGECGKSGTKLGMGDVHKLHITQSGVLSAAKYLHNFRSSL